MRNAEGAQRQRLRKREARLWSNGCPTRRTSLALAGGAPLVAQKRYGPREAGVFLY